MSSTLFTYCYIPRTLHGIYLHNNLHNVINIIYIIFICGLELNRFSYLSAGPKWVLTVVGNRTISNKQTEILWRRQVFHRMKGDREGRTPEYLETEGRRKCVLVKKGRITDSYIAIHRIWRIPGDDINVILYVNYSHIINYWLFIMCLACF